MFSHCSFASSRWSTMLFSVSKMWANFHIVTQVPYSLCLVLSLALGLCVCSITFIYSICDGYDLLFYFFSLLFLLTSMTLYFILLAFSSSRWMTTFNWEEIGTLILAHARLRHLWQASISILGPKTTTTFGTLCVAHWNPTCCHSLISINHSILLYVQ